jgi:1-deoxy-D-xylulose-5-phosphate reductoisomerase
MQVRHVAVLGSTGSIGVNTLAVIARQPERFRVVALSAHSRVEEAYEQCLRFRPAFAAMPDPRAAELLRTKLRSTGSDCEVLDGDTALERIASLDEVDTVVAGIVGAAGLKSALAAAHAGKRVLLANKEALVMAGGLFMATVKASGATLLPVDSEHNAILQALPRHFAGDLDAVGVRRIVLTASGGPFRTLRADQLENVTVAQACAHPNWVMGPKISVDSATMMNKGLEVIEARWLFNAPGDRIGVVIHPQSIVHSMVEYRDGSTIAQLGQPDMRTPIAYALSYPERIESGVEPLDLARAGRLDFHPPDFERFPCLRLAFSALERGGTAPAVLNAANEVAVAGFLCGKMPFFRIGELIEAVMSEVSIGPADTLEAILVADRIAREAAAGWIGRNCLVGSSITAHAGGGAASIGRSL